MLKGMPMKSDNHVYEMIVETADGSAASVQAAQADQKKSLWNLDHQEGQLNVDVGETKDAVIVVTTMAGADTSRIEVYVHNDLLTIRGRRPLPEVFHTMSQIYHQECFWGAFSRTVVLPVDVNGDLAQASYANGVLTITIPKKETDAKVPVTIVEE